MYVYVYYIDKHFRTLMVSCERYRKKKYTQYVCMCMHTYVCMIVYVFDVFVCLKWMCLGKIDHDLNDLTTDDG